MLFAHGKRQLASSLRNRFVADVLVAAGPATPLFDLLTPVEDRTYANRFDIALLDAYRRRDGVAHDRTHARDVAGGCFGASTSAAVALDAAAVAGTRVRAVVSMRRAARSRARALAAWERADAAAGRRRGTPR